MRAIIKEEVNTQLPQILPQALSYFSTHVIEKNVTELLEATVLIRSSSQPKYTYEVAASLFEFKLTKILLEKMEESKSHLRVDYKKKLYDALVESYNTDKDLFNTYGEVFTLKRCQDVSDKDRDPSAGSDQGTKRRKSSNEAESSRDSRSKEKKSSSTSKDASQYQHKSSGKSAHAEEQSHTVDDSGLQQDQEFDTVTRLSIMKKYDYGHLEEIEVRREDQKLYKFREGDFPQLCLRRHDIDKQLYERRLMRSLEKFMGGREYGNDLRLLERTI
ncbi:hypothetical protein Tco_0435523 [Tanacetum coccineum]